MLGNERDIAGMLGRVGMEVNATVQGGLITTRLAGSAGAYLRSNRNETSGSDLLAWHRFWADDGRSLSEPLHLNMAHRDPCCLRSGSDRAVRRKPVVRSGQDVVPMGFQSY